MKAKALFIGMFFLAGTANVFAGTNAAVEAKNLMKAETKEVTEVQKADEAFFTPKMCKVTVTWTSPGGSTVTLTATTSCDNCTQQQACDAAYALVSILIPG